MSERRQTVSNNEAVENTELEIDEEETLSDVASLSKMARVGSLLLASAKPISIETLKSASGLPQKELKEALEELTAYYQDEVHGFSLHEVAGGYQFRTAPAAKELIRKLFPPRSRRLSRAALETLSIIAYKQPVQRAEIESIRGVDALPTLRTLIETNLIRIVGYQDAPGQPALYGTTSKFLEQFGLRDLTDLPSLRELEQIQKDPGEGNSEGIEGSDQEESDEEGAEQILSEDSNSQFGEDEDLHSDHLS